MRNHKPKTRPCQNPEIGELTLNNFPNNRRLLVADQVEEDKESQYLDNHNVFCAESFVMMVEEIDIQHFESRLESF